MTVEAKPRKRSPETKASLSPKGMDPLLRQAQKYSQASLMLKQLMNENEKSRQFLSQIKVQSSEMMNSYQKHTSETAHRQRDLGITRRKLQQLIDVNREKKFREKVE